MRKVCRTLRIERLGRVSYGPMLDLQTQRHSDVLSNVSPDTLFLLEHEHVITKGRNAKDENVLWSKEALAARGVEFFETGRGGDATYHGPGQIVGYPILYLQEDERDVRRYVCLLEEIMIATARDFGIEARRIEGLRGIFVGNDKLAAIGVRLSRWATLHGFAFNVSTDLRQFSLIVPCGLSEHGVTSLEKLLGRTVPLKDVEDRLIAHAGQLLNREVVE
jgi:lipoyl(octanoyl) transferase